ncbi:MAG: glycosyltransferase [Candidatus Aminicenantes bacterium]|nr:glycosyltransferase [Candidatus Aminicenantes bacterium]
MIHFVVPFYNNEPNLEANVRALHHFLKQHLGGGFELVLCNDGSTDRSAEIAGRLARSFSRMRIVGYAPNRGRGFAVRFAAETCRGEYLIYADLDLPQTTDLGHILDMTRSLQDCQVVVGSRFLRESETQRIWRRRAVSWAYRLLVRLFFPKLKIKDPDAGFKGFRLDGLKLMNRLSCEDRWSWDLEMLIIARANGFSVAEIPIDWNERHDRYVSSVNIFRDGWEEFTGMFRIRKNLKRGLYKL